MTLLNSHRIRPASARGSLTQCAQERVYILERLCGSRLVGDPAHIVGKGQEDSNNWYCPRCDKLMPKHVFKGSVKSEYGRSRLCATCKQALGRWRLVLRLRTSRLRKNGFLPERQRLDRPTAKKRFDVLERDGFACRYCGRRAPEYEIIVEHIIPRCHGGSSEPYNLVAACAECNDGKGTRLLSQQIQPIPRADWVL